MLKKIQLAALILVLMALPSWSQVSDDTNLPPEFNKLLQTRSVKEAVVLRTCEANVDDLRAAVEQYAQVHQGHYPQKLENLVPTYLASLPYCPSKHIGYKYVINLKTGKYKISCNGEHNGVFTEYPMYATSDGGVVVKFWPGYIADFERSATALFLLSKQLSEMTNLLSKQLSEMTKQSKRAKEMSLFAACKSNLKNLATALEMYATDHNGHYPKQLQEGVPNYLKELPSCPTTKAEYSYTLNADANKYELVCRGKHEGLPLGYPRYKSDKGLLTGQ